MLRIFSLCLSLTAAACVDKTLPDWATGDYDALDAGDSLDSGAAMEAGASLLDARSEADGSAQMPDGSGAPNASDAAIDGGD